MRIERRFTTDGADAYASIAFTTTNSEIKNPDGSVVFQAKDIEVPAGWSQVACDVLAQKYFRKRGLPAALKSVEENDVPSWLWRKKPDDAALAKLPETARIVGEKSAKQVFDRLAGTWTYWGWKGGYFDSEEDARAYFDEMRYMLAAQVGAPNSPQWFNTGLHWAYGIDGPGPGTSSMLITAPASWCSRLRPMNIRSPMPASSSRWKTTSSTRAASWTCGPARRGCSNTAPAPAPISRACAARDEKLSGGGKSSGLMSFLKIGDRAAGCHQVWRHHAPRRQDGDLSISTIPISRPSSTGRWWRSRRWRPWSPARKLSPPSISARS